MPDALSEVVIERVLEFDVKTTGSLEAACRSAGKNFTEFDRLLVLADSEDTRLQTAATWVVRKLLELGAELTSAQLERFVESAAAQTAWEARLHIAQSIQFIGDEDLEVQKLAKIIQPWCNAKRPFLRAWALDAICRLAQRDPGLKPTASERLARGAEDPAASVRARVRNLRKTLAL
ncbi:hypothetical protein [Pelagibius sp. Alg239-R121]|uniref:hypothetical protein n=1 Tax=Pelagibius sp. Alg239-R121 TaxID=2993448 RepID=UPI0024A74EC1|nr:hypothetical protein [Pelagibius sp. Alg239-R121]